MSRGKEGNKVEDGLTLGLTQGIDIRGVIFFMIGPGFGLGQRVGFKECGIGSGIGLIGCVRQKGPFGCFY